MIRIVLRFTIFFLILLPFVVVAQTAANPRQQFIQKVAHSAKISDQAILADRASIKKYYKKWQTDQDLHWWDLRWLNKIALKYKIKNPNFKRVATWKMLLNRVDLIPVSLVVAQAANESNWGRSRFAHEANNYFGIHCMKLGCGLVPKKRAKGETFEVQRFANLSGSVKVYMLMLNSRGAYHRLRVERANLRAQNKIISGLVLAQGLANFSEHPKYIQIIQLVIRKFHLDRYDQPAFLTK